MICPSCTPCSMPIASTASMTDLAFAGLAQHTELLARGETTSQELTELFLERIDAPRPDAQRLPRGVRRAWRAPRPHQADARRRERRPAPAAGRPAGDQGRHGHRRAQVTAMGSCAVEEPAQRRLRGRAAAAQRRRRDPRQDARARDDDRAVHGVADVRHHPQPVGPAAHARRLERRLGRGGRRRAVLGGARLRRRRLDPHPGRLLRAVRPQAAARPRADRAHGGAVARAVAPGARSRAASPTRALLLRRDRATAGARRSPTRPRASPASSGSRSPATSRR